MKLTVCAPKAYTSTSSCQTPDYTVTVCAASSHVAHESAWISCIDACACETSLAVLEDVQVKVCIAVEAL